MRRPCLSCRSSPRPAPAAAVLCAAASLAALAGCSRMGQAGRLVALPSTMVSQPLVLARALDQARAPSHQRAWRPELAVLPYAETDRTTVTVRNVRRCRWHSEQRYDVRHQDWTFDQRDVQAVDFIVVPFTDSPLLAHTMLSFDLGGGRHLVASVEARLEKGESYSPVAGSARQFELMYVLADEQDVLGLRAEVRGDQVYLYRSVATPEQSAALLQDVLQRANQIAARPEFYDSLTNNCTTNLVAHINRLRPGSIPDSLRKMLPGHSDSLAYDLGLLATDLPFAEARRQAYLSLKIRQHLNDPHFSQRIRAPRFAPEPVSL